MSNGREATTPEPTRGADSRAERSVHSGAPQDAALEGAAVEATTLEGAAAALPLNPVHESLAELSVDGALPRRAAAPFQPALHEHSKRPDPATRNLLTTGDMARLSSSTLRTVRFYEEAGILEPAERGESGHRLFPKSELDKLRLVGELRLLGLPLDEIKTLFELKKSSRSGGQAACDALLRLETYLERVRERLDRLRTLEREIEDACAAIRRCQGCTDNHLFPESCGECRTMKDAGDLPPATTVLWGLKR